MIKTALNDWPVLTTAMAISLEDAKAHLDHAAFMAACLETRTGFFSTAGGWWIMWYVGKDSDMRPVFACREHALTESQKARHLWSYDDLFKHGAMPEEWLTPRRLTGISAGLHAKRLKDATRAEVRKDDPIICQIAGNNWVIGKCEEVEWPVVLSVRTPSGVQGIRKGYLIQDRDGGCEILWSRGHREYESYMAARSSLWAAQKLADRKGSKKQLTE